MHVRAHIHTHARATAHAHTHARMQIHTQSPEADVGVLDMGTYTLSSFYTESAALVFLALSPSPSLAEKRWRMVEPDNLDDLRGSSLC